MLRHGVRSSRATFLLPVKTRGILSFVTGETRFGFLFYPSSAQSSPCSSLKDASKAYFASTQPGKRFPQCRKGNSSPVFRVRQAMPWPVWAFQQSLAHFRAALGSLWATAGTLPSSDKAHGLSSSNSSVRTHVLPPQIYCHSQSLI